MKKNQNKYTLGWDEAKVLDVVRHYERQSEEEAVAEDEAASAASELDEKLRAVVDLLQPYDGEQLEAAIKKVARAEVEHDDPIRPRRTTSSPSD